MRKIAWVFDADANEANVPNWAIIQGAAAWSLRSNAKQHAKVQQCLEDIAAAENEPIAVRSKIQELLAENEEDQGRSQ
ncbi:MAG: hypothetical protein IT424_03640 [Pirellulales bacterium]|nr:hypothetical protein [Pirellulales bacterium]